MSDYDAPNDVDYDDVPVACTLDDAEKAQRRDWVAATLLESISDVEERPDGYEFVFQGTDEVLDAASTFVEREATCCPFARFRIEVPQGFGTVRLLFAGPEGTKPFLEEGLVSEFDLET